MGTIQQAFNQALGITAVAMGPQLAEQQKAKSEIQAIRDASEAVDKAEELRLALAENPKSTSAELDLALETSIAKQTKLHQLNPTIGNTQYLAALRDERTENAAYDAARRVAKQKEIYNDQQANMNAVKSKRKQQMEQAARRQESAALAAKRTAIQTAEQKRRLNNG